MFAQIFSAASRVDTLDPSERGDDADRVASGDQIGRSVRHDVGELRTRPTGAPRITGEGGLPAC